MSIVITGASGNIGSAVLRELTAQGRHDVEAVARRLPTTADPPYTSLRWRAVDVARDDLAPTLKGAQAVVHLAWKFQPTHRPDVTWATNVAGTRRLLEAARRAEVPAVVYLSSIAAYSPRTADDPVDETWPTTGTSEAGYCREKAMVERLLDAFEISNPQVRIVRLRPTFVFQRSAASEQRRIFGGRWLPRAFLDRRRLPLVPLPTGLRFQAVHAGDVARAVEAAVRLPVAGPFNLAGPGVLRRDDIGELMGARVLDVPPGLARRLLDVAWRLRIAQVPGSLLEALMDIPVLSTERARAELGWSPHHSGADAVEAVLRGIAERSGSSSLRPLHP